MGKPCFSKTIKFFAIALLGAATAIAAVVALSSPADAAEGGGGGGFGEAKSWDTDNLRYSVGGAGILLRLLGFRFTSTAGMP